MKFRTQMALVVLAINGPFIVAAIAYICSSGSVSLL